MKSREDIDLRQLSDRK